MDFSIELKELQEWAARTKNYVPYASCAGMGFSRDIGLDTKGRFVVVDHQKEVYRGKSIQRAIKLYNSPDPVLKTKKQ